MNKFLAKIFCPGLVARAEELRNELEDRKNEIDRLKKELQDAKQKLITLESDIKGYEEEYESFARFLFDKNRIDIIDREIIDFLAIKGKSNRSDVFRECGATKHVLSLSLDKLIKYKIIQEEGDKLWLAEHFGGLWKKDLSETKKEYREK